MTSTGTAVLTRILPAATDESVDRHLCRELGAAVAAGSRRIVIDLERTDIVETSTLRTLIGVGRTVRERGGQLGIVATREQARAMLALTGLDKIFAVYGSTTEAAAPAGQ